MTNRAYIIAAKRSAVAPRGGAFADVPLHDLAAPVITAALRAAGLTPKDTQELVLSNALYGGGNPARVAALAAGLPEHVAGLSLDRQCVGGLDAVMLAADMIMAGRCDVIVAGGAESASLRPKRFHAACGDQPAQEYDAPPFTPWPHRDPNMHVAADALAQKLGISRKDQDDWAVNSHAHAMSSRGPMAEGIVPIKGLTQDAYTRKLTPALCARAQVISGSITLANTAVSADAAAFLVLVSETKYNDLGRPPAVEILTGTTMGSDPMYPGLAPIAAINACLKTANIRPGQLAHAEIMEAYAAQALACVDTTHLPRDSVNQHGGALARGHPIGASGAILAVHLFHQIRTKGGTGLAAIAAAGGLGSAVILHAR